MRKKVRQRERERKEIEDETEFFAERDNVISSRTHPKTHSLAKRSHPLSRTHLSSTPLSCQTLALSLTHRRTYELTRLILC